MKSFAKDGCKTKSSYDGKCLALSRKALFSSGVAIACWLPVSAAPAQNGGAAPSGLPASVEVRAPDENGVDMYSGSAKFTVPDVSLGGLTHIVSSLPSIDPRTKATAFVRSAGLMDNYKAIFVNSGCPTGPCQPTFTVGTGAVSEQFVLDTSTGGFKTGTSGGSLVGDPDPSDPNCSKVVAVQCKNLIYFPKSGVAISLTSSDRTGRASVVNKISYPDGTIERVTHAADGPVLSVNRSDGLQLKYQYGENWDLKSVVAINGAYQYCDPTSSFCQVESEWPRSSYVWLSSPAGNDTILEVSNSGGQVTRYSMDSLGRVRAVKPPTSDSDLLKFDYCLRRNEYNPYAYGERDPHACFYNYVTPYGTSIVYIEDRILSVVRDGQTWKYGYSVEGSTVYPNTMPPAQPVTATRPDGKMTIVNVSSGPTYVIDFTAPGVYAEFEQNLANKVHATWLWSNGGVGRTYTYDDRANVTSDGVISAGYELECQNVKTCNKPNWTRDAKGLQTDYVYDPQHGGILSVTLPAGPSGVRPQTRYYYTKRYAWFLSAVGQMNRSPDPVWKLSSQSTCRNGAAAEGGGCLTPADEIVTTYDYGPDSGPNNLWLRGTAVTTGGVTLRTCFGYDKFGNKISTTTPRAGLASC